METSAAAVLRAAATTTDAARMVVTGLVVMVLVNVEAVAERQLSAIFVMLEKQQQRQRIERPKPATNIQETTVLVTCI